MTGMERMIRRVSSDTSAADGLGTSEDDVDGEGPEWTPFGMDPTFAELIKAQVCLEYEADELWKEREAATRDPPAALQTNTGEQLRRGTLGRGTTTSSTSSTSLKRAKTTADAVTTFPTVVSQKTAGAMAMVFSGAFASAPEEPSAETRRTSLTELRQGQ
eukprot:7380895-Prymnesium_polylepis.1